MLYPSEVTRTFGITSSWQRLHLKILKTTVLKKKSFLSICLKAKFLRLESLLKKVLHFCSSIAYLLTEIALHIHIIMVTVSA